MTYRDVMLRALLQATGEPRSHLEYFLDHLAAKKLGPNRMAEEISPDRQAELEKSFADEASGILAWYVREMRGNEELIQSRGQALQRENAATQGRGRKR